MIDFEREIKLLEGIRDNVVVNHMAARSEINRVIEVLREAASPGVPQGAPETAQERPIDEKPTKVVIEPGALDETEPSHEKEHKAKKKSK